MAEGLRGDFAVGVLESVNGSVVVRASKNEPARTPRTLPLMLRPADLSPTYFDRFRRNQHGNGVAARVAAQRAGDGARDSSLGPSLCFVEPAQRYFFSKAMLAPS